MSAETLRRAAENIRSDAPFGTPDGTEFFLAVADWLDRSADWLDRHPDNATPDAAKVARAYLRERA